MPYADPAKERECQRLWSRRRYWQDPARQSAKSRAYRDRDRAKFNRECRERFLKRVKLDPTLKVRSQMQSQWPRRCRDRGVYTYEPILELIGCSWERFCAHIEGQFEWNMDWTTHGQTWVLDHRWPLEAFDLRDEIERRMACHFSNFRPLAPGANLRKQGYFNRTAFKAWKAEWWRLYGPGQKAARLCHQPEVCEQP
jgi:hypothetical protein